MNARLKELRKILSITQTELADKLHTSRSYICRIENGERNISNKMKDEICNIYSINREWLENGIGEPIIKQPVINSHFVDMVFHAMLHFTDEQWAEIDRKRTDIHSL